MQDIEIHLSVLRELFKILVHFRDDVTEKLAELERVISQLPELGVPVQIAEHYEVNYGAQNIQYLRNLIAKITDKDLPEINAKTVQLEIEKNMIYQGYSNTPVCRIEGNMIYEGYSGTPVYRIEGNMIYKGYSGEPVYRIESNMIYRGYSNTPVYRIEGNIIYEGYSNTPVSRID